MFVGQSVINMLGISASQKLKRINNAAPSCLVTPTTWMTWITAYNGIMLYEGTVWTETLKGFMAVWKKNSIISADGGKCGFKLGEQNSRNLTKYQNLNMQILFQR